MRSCLIMGGKALLPRGLGLSAHLGREGFSGGKAGYTLHPLGVGGGTGGWGTVGHLLRAHNAKAKNPNRHTHDIPSAHECATSCIRYVFRLHKSLAKCATSTYNLHTEARRAAGAAVRTVELFSLHCSPLRYRPRGETCFRFPLVSESVDRRAY